MRYVCTSESYLRKDQVRRSQLALLKKEEEKETWNGEKKARKRENLHFFISYILLCGGKSTWLWMCVKYRISKKDTSTTNYLCISFFYRDPRFFSSGKHSSNNLEKKTMQSGCSKYLTVDQRFSGKIVDKWEIV